MRYGVNGFRSNVRHASQRRTPLFWPDEKRTLVIIVAIILAWLTIQTSHDYGIGATAQTNQPSPHLDSRVLHTVMVQSLRYPAPAGCTIVGGIEDGSLIASCADSGSLIAHGPDSTDAWSNYQGPVFPRWQFRIACADGQSSVSYADCNADPLVRFTGYVQAGDVYKVFAMLDTYGARS